MNQYAFTFIIGYRHKIDRLNNLRRTLDWINGFSGGQIILVEQDKHTKISHLNLKCQHIFVKSNMPYNRSWAFNVGLKHAKSNIIVFSDSDLIMNPNDFIEGLKAMQQYEMLSPYNSVVDLTQQESGLPLEQIVNINRAGRGETDNQKINISGGISIFRKDAIMKLGGWSESFIGWGGEDDFQTIKVKNFLTWTELKARCYHLWHQREQPDMRFYQRTLNILQQANQMTKEQLQSSISKSIPSIGMRNKYDSF
jgi:cellulose synthase/poly-beta-1,6-N-acetylglucosamine synthase-like glycosyltransferase